MRKNSSQAEMEYILIPIDFNEIRNFVTLTAGVTFVNGIVFLNTLSMDIILCTAEHLPSSMSK